MPYKDPRRRRRYHRRYMRTWIAERKRRMLLEFYGSLRCEFCGSQDYDDLRLHHVDPEEKDTHRIWSWSEDRIRKELAKCMLLCHSCHVEIHRAMRINEPEPDPALMAQIASNLQYVAP